MSVKRTCWSGYSVLSDVFSYEFLFVCFLYVGVFEGEAFFRSAPWEWTSAFGLLCGFGMLAIFRPGTIRISKQTLIYLLAFGGLILWAVISITWAQSPKWGPIVKAGRITFGAGLAVTASALVVGQSHERVGRLLRLFVVFGVIFAVLTILSRGVPFPSANRIAVSRPIGIASICLLVASLRYRKAKSVILVLSFLLICLIALVISGARGPFIGVIIGFGAVGLFIAPDYQRYLSHPRAIATFVVGVSILSIIGLLLIGTQRIFHSAETVERLFGLINGLDTSSLRRLDMYDSAITLWTKDWISFLFGNGIGSFELLYTNVDGVAHPHNLILEVAIELGFIGLLLLLLILVIPTQGLVALRNRNITCELILIGCATYMFTNTMVSGQLYSNRYLYVFLSLLIATPKK